MRHSIFAVLLLLLSTRAMAVPEVARYGHFTCVSCHVSPSGGGMLTSYGRVFAVEKLSTWHFVGEERPLYGLMPTTNTVTIGGDSRWMSYQSKSDTSQLSKFWRMQSDLSIGGHYGPVWLSVTGGTKPAGPFDDQSEHQQATLRGYAARVDLFSEHVTVRAGLFMPKYGLMIEDHTAFIRSVTGLGPTAEQTQIEATYQADQFEVTAAGLIVDNSNDRKGRSRAGVNLGGAVFLAGRHRLNLNLLSTSLTQDGNQSQQTAFGTSGTLTLTRIFYGMYEVDRVTNSQSQSGSTQTTAMMTSYLRAAAHVFKGVDPFVQHEYLNSDVSQSNAVTQKLGGGANWYPRPHFQMEGRVFRITQAATNSSSTESDMVLHYYF